MHLQNVASSIQPRAAGYWEGVPKRVFARGSSGQVADIQSQCTTYPGVPLWDLRGFCKRFGQSIADFLTEYVKTPAEERFISEHISRDVPCKLFFDVEHDVLPGTEPNLIRKLISRVIDVAIDQLCTSTGMMPDSDFATEARGSVVVLYANLPTKGSAHVIFQVVFQNVNHVKQFVTKSIFPILDADPLFSVPTKDGNQRKNAVDCSVYSADRLFRVCGSCKFEQGRSKKNPLLPDEGTFTDRMFVRSLLTIIAVAEEDIALIQKQSSLRDVIVVNEVWAVQEKEGSSIRIAMGTPRAGPAKRQRTSMESATTYPTAELMVDRLLAHHPLLKDQEPKYLKRRPVIRAENGRHHACIIIASAGNKDAIACPNKRSAHRSNAIYFHVNLSTQEGYFSCPDIACKGKNTWGRCSQQKYFTMGQ